jgi:hypothetical protein
VHVAGISMSRKQRSKIGKAKRRRGQNTVVPSTYPEDYIDGLADKYQEIFDDIDSHIQAASELISKMDPVNLLARSFGEYAALTLGKTTEVELGETHAIARRMIDYVQCLIVAIPPCPDGYVDITEELWLDLKRHIASIFNNLTFHFITASAKRNKASDFDEDWEDIFTKAQMNWCFVKGNRHLNYLSVHLRSLLSPHNDIFNELFGITIDQFISELENIRVALTSGLFDSVIEMNRIHKEFFEKLDQDIESPPDGEEELGAFFRRKMEEYGYKEQFDTAGEKFLGSDLFDLDKTTNLPTSVLEHLSLSPGGDKKFLYEGEFKGWPLSLWPIWNKPFLKIGDKYYCFDMYTLSDNIYRAIQKIIFQLKPQYKNIWVDRQQKMSEDLPFQMLEKLLPGAISHRNIYYTRRTGRDNALNWVECDGLLLYDDNLFIVEVKAGAFTYTPPATDAPAYIQSIKDLIFKPAEQGQRFLEYLNSAENVPIYDNDHIQIGELTIGKLRQITICCVTLDQMTLLSAKSSQLKFASGSNSISNIWNISIDDLRVYSDIFLNPLQFLHFVEQRHAASKTSLITLDDELEHIGLYIAKNHYAQFARDLVSSQSKQPDLLIWTGFTSTIDKYYSDLLSGEDALPPQQPMPPLLMQILEVLARGQKPGRARVGSILLDMSEEARNSFVKSVNRSGSLTKKRGEPVPISLVDHDIQITLYTNPTTRSFREKFDLVEYVLSFMTLRQEQERLLLEIFVNQKRLVIDVDYLFVKAGDIVRYERNNIEMMAKELGDKRVQVARTRGKIKFNGQCPCGSGKKYKDCHGPLKKQVNIP